jgi:hypothetical protein
MLASQNVVIGIAVVMFLVGLGFGYVAFMGTGNMMNNQQAMIHDPQFNQQMMESITQDSEAMRIWMENTQHAEDMGIMMRENHDFAMQMMFTIIEDPTIRLQMLGHMTENKETMDQMMGMMGYGMQGIMDQDMMMQMMQDPETKEKMIQIMAKHVSEMQELLTSELTDDEFNTQMTELMQNHMSEMQGLMSSQPMHNSMN